MMKLLTNMKKDMNASIKECMCSYSTDRLKNIYAANKDSDSLSERQKYIINVVENELKERDELDEGTWEFDNDKADEIISRLNSAKNTENAGELELIAKEAFNVVGDDLVSDALDDAVYAMQMGNKRDADMAIESAIERIEELVGLTIDEMSTTGSAPGYNTPNAFSKSGKEDEKNNAEKVGMKKKATSKRNTKNLKESAYKKMMSSMLMLESTFSEYSDSELIEFKKILHKQRATAASRNQQSLANSLSKDIEKVNKELKLRGINESDLVESVSYREFKQDPTCSPQQKVNKGIAEVNKMLREMEKIVTNNLKLKNEMGVKSDHFWKSTGNRFAKINERMTRISNKLKELSQ